MGGAKRPPRSWAPLLAFAGAALGAGVAQLFVASRGPVSPPATARVLEPVAGAPSEPETARLLEDVLLRLDSLQDALARSGGSEAVPVVGAPTPNDAGERVAVTPDAPWAELARGLEALRESVRSLEESLALHSGKELPPTLEEIRAGRDSIDWGFVEELYAQWKVLSHRRLAEDRLRFLSYGEVLRTIGRPTSIGDDGEWVYQRPPIDRDEQHPKGLTLRFRGGYVTTMIVNLW